MPNADDRREQVRARTPIAALIAETVNLEHERSALRGACPLHPDRYRGLYVSADRDHFHCFSCGAGGDVVQWIMQLEHVSEEEALARLISRAPPTIS
ncbi:CHC2 zinc finger domain-containing protein [Sphingomonas sp. IC-56]|uniref:CHC2 zinc finger domain-containing protein n=1 Tax=Sphingomonas sp. IC-56 TaxID=2898529 RepID=UPI001E399A8C|nr:CHC2 zinc finger domain-containing protein [Sphingomonas sp. IC-56]MCD2323063.1 CHC2 zinc finger domain-containing protein [Sphingomonas sp. IC-56]